MTPPSDLPLHGGAPTTLPAPPADASERLDAALASDDPAAALREVVADHPAFLDGWARLSALSLDAGDPVAAYAFARTGYHRGLDAIRRAGWGGSGPVPWEHPPNRGFLRSVDALRRAAAAIGEDAERDRCRTFLAELDPSDGLGIGGGPDAPGGDRR